MNMQEKLDQILGKEISQASNEEIYDALLTIVQEMASKKERTDSKKKLYYISAEFLIGKLLSNNMINLGIYKEVKEILEKHGKNLSEIEEIEPEPSLGNGGAWKTCSVLPGFHCNAWTCGRWCRTELSSWIVQTGI